MSGWVKLHRKFNNWEWRDKPEMVSLFLHILMEANYEERKWHGVLLKRGQCVFGRRKWSDALGISERSLRTCLERLKSTHELTIETTNQFSILTIVNYEEYQSENSETTRETTRDLGNERPAIDQQSTTPKEVKKERSKEYTQDFIEFWEIYPRREARAKAEKAYGFAIKSITGAELNQRAKRFAELCKGKDKNFIPFAASWLNGKRWEDETQEIKQSERTLTIQQIKEKYL